MASPLPTVEILPSRGFDIWLHCYFLTGLIQLAQRREVRLRFTTSRPDPARFPWLADRYPLLTLRVAGRIACFDPADHADRWQTDALAGCDAYFKRSFHPPEADRLPVAHRAKVRPLNPMFATWTRAPIWTARTYAAIGRQTPRSQARRSWLTFSTLSALDQYEDAPATAKQPLALFQTRLWNPAEEQGDWVAPTNAHRVEMVRTLRARLGDRLVGGLIREPYAEQHHPDLLSNLTATAKAKRPHFIRLCRQFLIRINIKALHDAIPYSLAETLAANNCLVSETIRNTPAIPLEDGRHYLSFTTAAECAERCRELLDSPARAMELRVAAHDYYRRAVHPAAAMRACLAPLL